ncbi:hypothetical protein DV735_g5359, partial [Chaetothyriales sp. CBS 134920]
MTARQEYPALLAALAPDEAVQLLNDRVAVIKQVNSSVADWLQVRPTGKAVHRRRRLSALIILQADIAQERRKVEDAYVQGLRRLASRPQHDGGAALGVFQIPWQRIVSGTENLAASHEILSHKIETGVEAPLRRFNGSNREMQAVSSSHPNLASIARGIESAQKKAAKGGRKAEDATSSVDEASRAWESQAPYVFEQLQALDEQRINHLRDVLTQLQTDELDHVERVRTSAESCLNALLNVETADEIKAFAGKAAAARRGSLGRRSSAIAGAGANSIRPASSSASTHHPPAVPPPRQVHRHPTQPSAISYDQTTAFDQTPHKSKLGGLKRLGTVIKGRKSIGPGGTLPGSLPEKKEKKGRPFSAFRRADSSTSFQDLETTGQDLPSQNTEESRNALTQVQSTVTETQEEITPRGSPQTEETAARDPVVNGNAYPPRPGSASTSDPSQPTQRQTDELAVLQPIPAQGQQAVLQPIPAQGQQAVLQPIPAQGQQAVSQAAPTAVSPTLQQEASPVAESDEGARNFAIRDKPIREDESEANFAINSMAQHLRVQAQSSGLSRNQATVRGRRDVRNTVFIPSGVDSATLLAGGAAVGAAGAVGAFGAAAATAASPSAQTSSPADSVAAAPRAPVLRTLHEDVGVGSDTTSVHSVHSLAGQPHHPELHEPGLNASIVETVNTWFNESGITKAFATGEIALAYNTTLSTEADTTLIRLQNFELLEKVAANPVFIGPPPQSDSAAEESAGTYTVSLSSIRRSTPLVGLKYQLHIDAASLSQYSPLLLTPAWQVIEGQASVIVQYALNPIFAASATTPAAPVTLRNVVISVSLDPSGPPPQSALMSPKQGASFRRKTATVIWRLPEFTLDPEPARLLVRFITPPGTTAKKGRIELKFELPGRAAKSQ